MRARMGRNTVRRKSGEIYAFDTCMRSIVRVMSFTCRRPPSPVRLSGTSRLRKPDGDRQAAKYVLGAAIACRGDDERTRIHHLACFPAQTTERHRGGGVV